MGRILVADDDRAVRNLVAEILADDGHAVTTAADGAEALAALARAPVDLLVADVAMPRVSGPELVARLRLRGSFLPVLLVSSVTVAPPPLLNVGFLRKPFDVAALLELMRAQLGDG